MSDNRIIGCLSIIFGLLFIIALFCLDKSKLIFRDSNLFLVRFFIPILFVNTGLYLAIFGVLQLIGILVPYRSESISKEDKAKHHVLAGFLAAPIFISMISTIFTLSKSIFWKLAGIVIVVYYIWMMLSGISILKKARKT